MQAPSRIRRLAGDVASSLFSRLSPVRWKEFNELAYWKRKQQAEGVVSNQHYEHFYTAHFGLDASYYQNKVILDIGCGPRGSLEWASMASRRIGLDPLAKEYLKLGARHHRMEYMDASSESIPLADSECDAVVSFNSLDHVEDFKQTIREIKRVTRPGGIFLLLVEINHPPTACEPNELTPGMLVDALRPEFRCDSLRVYRAVSHGMYDSIWKGEQVPAPEATREPGYLSGKFVRNTPG